ncbi:MAG: hypothetical protein DSY59_02275 [Persephonella sp.]|nr:MAG: hypothetical protein DSY59_02275 [Persephonella sp.]
MDFEILKAQWEELAVWKKLLIVIGLSLGIAYLVYMFIVSEKIKEIEKMRNEIENLNMEFANIKRNAPPEKRAKLQQELEKEKERTELLKVELEDVRAKFLPRDDAQTTLVFITEEAKKNNLILNRFVIKGVKDVYLRYNPATDKIEYITNQSSNNSTNRGSSIIPRGLKSEKKEQSKNQNTADMPTVHLKKVDMGINIIGSSADVFKFIKEVSFANNYVRIERVSLNRGSKTNILNASVELSAFYSPEDYTKDMNNKKTDIFCKMKDVYYKCNEIAKSQKILKNLDKCSKLSENFTKNEVMEYKKSINSACFAGCIDDKNFIKNIQKKCK